MDLFHHCGNMIKCTYPKLSDITYQTLRLYGIPFLYLQLFVDGNVIMQCMNVNRAFKEVIKFKWLSLNEAVRVSLNSVWLERTFWHSDIRIVHTQKKNHVRTHWEGGHLQVSKGSVRRHPTCLHIDLSLQNSEKCSIV